MQRVTAAGRLAGALAIALALPLSFGHGAFAAERLAGASAAGAAQGVPARWRNYALASITPNFSWALDLAPAAVPQVIDAAFETNGLAMAIGSLGGGSSAFSFSSASMRVDGKTPSLVTQPSSQLVDVPSGGLHRHILASSYTHGWGDQGVFAVSALLSYQRFASLGLGAVAADGGIPPTSWAGNETSYGSGVRIDLGSALTERMRWSAAYQSRINMDAFNTYRGVYSEPGQFDVPASASVGIGYALTPSMSVDVGAERVMYSSITPFTSAALPTRLLALLGNGASPQFAWSDLTVYSAGWTLRDARFGDLELRYTSGQQPSPTSALLRAALAPDMADGSLALGYSHAVGRSSRFSLRASYTNAPYFLGVPSYRLRDRATAEQIEFEALWAARF